MRTRSLALVLAFTAAAGRASALDPEVARAAEAGLDELYGLRFESALASFDRLGVAFPQHPAGPALLAAARWWEARYWFTRPDAATTRLVQEEVDRAVALSRSLSARPGYECEGKFFLGGSLGVRAHWSLLQGHWVTAALQSREAIGVLTPLLGCTEYADDVCLGLGLYEYVASSLPVGMRALSKLLVGGGASKADALAKLARAAEHGRFVRHDAQATLVSIYTLFDRDPAKALVFAERLLRERPSSPLSHTLWLQALVFADRWNEALAASHRALELAAVPGSAFALEAPAYHYFEGVALLGLRKPAEAEAAFTGALALPGRPTWLAAARAKRGNARDLLGRRADALADYRALLKGPDPWRIGRRTKRHLKTPFTWPDFETEFSPHGGI